MGNKQEITIDDLRKMQLEILIDVDQFCNENNLRHWICGGTLIGAVRHKGFIPWDDDIDIAMPRPDYEKFIETYTSEKFTLFKPLQKGYYLTLAVVSYNGTKLDMRFPLGTCSPPVGVHIDIIPQDGQPFDEEDFKKKLTEVIRLIRISRVLRYNKNIPYLIKNPLFAFKQVLRNIKYIKYSLKGVLADIERIARECQYDESKFVGNMSGVSPYGYKERFKREWFDGPYEYFDFEGHKFPAPSGWKKYLTYMYGDFMKLPPKEKQVPYHTWKSYWIDKNEYRSTLTESPANE